MSRKRKLLLALLLLLVLAVILFIFTRSMKDQAQSKEESRIFIRAIRPILWAIFGRGNVDTAWVVRKLAHLFEFFVLGAGICACMPLATKISRCRQRIYSMLSVLVIGAVDESIQLFNDRAPSLFDVGVDFVGGAMGVLTVSLILHLIAKRKNHEKEDN